MLSSVVVVPGPPALVAELMGAAAHELDGLRQATDLVVSRAVSDLVAASTGSSLSGRALSRLLIVGPGQPGEFDAAGPVTFGSFGHGVTLPALVEGGQTDRELPTPLMVARYLASRDIHAHPEHAELWASARWMTTRGADATALGEELRADGSNIALILVADGAACHGPKAPRAKDSRAAAYDDEVWAALASGQPGRLAQIDADLGHELGATGPQVWSVLLSAADGEGAGEVLWRGAPYGVGWAVASWRRPPKESEVTRA